MNRFILTGLLTLFIAGLNAIAEPSTSDSQLAAPRDKARPDILFIMTDQQHAGMLSCAGNKYLHTPALDSLAAAGTRFELAYATNPVCVPSRFSLQTGRMPSAVGMRSNEGQSKVPPQISAESLGPLLQKAGYLCAYGGKDHLPQQLSHSVMGPAYETLTPDARDKLAEACAKFLSQKHDKPFFLFASFINPHDVCHMAINDFARSQGRPVRHGVDTDNCERLLDQARKSGDLDAFIREHAPPLPSNYDIPAKEPDGIAIDYVATVPFRAYAREKWSEQMWRLHRWLYARLTEESDRRIGIVLKALKDAGLEENTIVIFTSDHGDMDSSHRLEHKSVLYEESARVPMLVAWKGTLPAGQVDTTHLVSTGLDLSPTLCDIAGITPPAGLAGQSLRPILEKKAPTNWRDFVVTESQNGRMVRTADWKYCVYEHGKNREMLIDMRNDPGEMNNLADSPEHHDELNHHRKLLQEWTNQINDKIAPSYLIAPD